MSKLKPITIGILAALAAIPAQAEIDHYGLNFNNPGGAWIHGGFDFNTETQSFSNAIIHFSVQVGVQSQAWSDWNFMCNFVYIGGDCGTAPTRYGTATLTGFINPVLDMSVFDPVSAGTIGFGFSFNAWSPMETVWRNPSGLAPYDYFSHALRPVSSTVPLGTDGNSDIYFYASAHPVPEPESYAMLLAGLGVLGAAVRRRKVKQN